MKDCGRERSRSRRPGKTSMRIAGLAVIGVLAVASCASDASNGRDRISRPSEYMGWSEQAYGGYVRTSFYVSVRDGTKLAVDLYRPTKGGAVASEKLPVVWMHSPYNRRTDRGGEAAETYPGFALKLAPCGYNVPWSISATFTQSAARTPATIAANGSRLRSSTPMSPPPAAQTTTSEAAPGGAFYETAALAADVEVTGDPVMTLWLRTDAGDADVTARIEDIASDSSTRSYQMIGRLRASHRQRATPPCNYLNLPWQTHLQADAKLVPAGQPVELKFDLLPMSYIFKAGHRLPITLTFADQQRRDQAPR